MKIAVIGIGPVGLETFLYFNDLEAEVIIFEQDKDLLSNRILQNSSMDENLGSITSKIGRDKLMKEFELSKIPSTKEYYETYYNPLVQKLMDENVIKFVKVQSVYKRFLDKNEVIENKSRLHDLFRVVYKKEGVVIADDNIEFYQDLEKKLGPEVFSSLKEGMEYFEDFDVVIDCSGVDSYANPMGPSGSFAIGEKRLQKSSQIFYGLKNCLNGLKNVDPSDHLVVVGSGEKAAKFILEIKDHTHITVITTHQNPFKEDKNLLKLILKKEEDFQTQIVQFNKKVNEWKELDDFIRVKTPMPPGPARELEILFGVNITNVDKLIDQERVYLTLERPTFRKHNLDSELKTLACDKVFVLTGHQYNAELSKGINSCEVGFYSLSFHGKNENLKLASVFEKLKEFELDLLNYFKRT